MPSGTATASSAATCGRNNGWQIRRHGRPPRLAGDARTGRAGWHPARRPGSRGRLDRPMVRNRVSHPRPRSAGGRRARSPMPRYLLQHLGGLQRAHHAGDRARARRLRRRLGTSPSRRRPPDTGSDSRAGRVRACGLEGRQSWPSKRSTAAETRLRLREHAGIGDQEARGKIVAAVADDVVVGDQRHERCPVCRRVRHAPR